MLERLVDMLAGHSLHAGYAVVLLLLVLCGFGPPLPEDVILVTGGVLAWINSDLSVTWCGSSNAPRPPATPDQRTLHSASACASFRGLTGFTK